MTPEQLQMVWLIWFTETLKVLSEAQRKAAADWRAGMDKVQGPTLKPTRACTPDDVRGFLTPTNVPSDVPPDWYFGYRPK